MIVTLFLYEPCTPTARRPQDMNFLLVHDVSLQIDRIASWRAAANLLIWLVWESKDNTSGRK
jgi:hypothetical protein